MDAAPPPPPSSYPAGSLRELLWVAIPLAISTGSVSVAQVADRAFLARFDPAALAASLPAGLLQWAVLSPFLGLGMTVSTFVAQNAAAGQPGRAAAAVWQGVWCSIAAALCFAALAPAAGPIFTLADHGPEVQRAEVIYFQMLCWGAFPTVASFALSGYYAGRGRTGVVMAANVVAAAVNILLDRILIFGVTLPGGLGEVPPFGIAGAGAATGLSFTATCAFYLFAMTRGAGRASRIYSHARFDRAMTARLLKVGVPTGLHMAADIVAFTVFLFLIGRLGRNELAASTLAFNLNGLCFLPAVGLGSAATVLVGHRVGEGRADLATRTGWLATAVGAVGMLVSGFVFVVYPEPLIQLYVGDGASFTSGELAALWATTPTLLIFVAVYSLFDVPAMVLGSAIRGAGDTTFPAVWTMLCAWGLLVAPAAWGILAGGWAGQSGVYHAWLCCTAYIVVVALGMIARFVGGKWRTMSVLEEKVVAEAIYEPDAQASAVGVADGDACELNDARPTLARRASIESPPPVGP